MKRRVIRVGVGLVAGWVIMAQGLAAPAESKKAGEKTPAQDESGAGMQVLEKGLNFTRVGWTNAVGRWGGRTNLSVTMLEPGKRYVDRETGELKESEDLIEPFEKGAIYRRGQTRITWESDLSRPGAVDIVMLNGKRLTGGPLGLALLNPNDRSSILIAEVKACKGKIDGTKVVFEDFLTDIKADCVFVATSRGLSQTVILREKIDPADYQMPPESRLEVISEYSASAQPVKIGRVIKESEGKKAVPLFTDMLLDFQALVFPSGAAFAISGGNVNVPDAVKSKPVGKHWEENIDGRSVLFESVELPSIQEHWKDLPAAKAPAGKKQASLERQVPARRVASAVKKEPMEVASVPYRGDGFAIDWEAEVPLSSDTGSFTFAAGKTYMVPTPVIVGTLTLEAGSTAKLARGAAISVYASLVCLGDFSTGRPSVLTGWDDDENGNPLPAYGSIPVSTGTPTGTYATWALKLANVNQPFGFEPHDLTIRYAAVAIWVQRPLNSAVQSFHHSRVENCGMAVKVEDTPVSLSYLNVCNTDKLYEMVPAGAAPPVFDHIMTDCTEGYAEIAKGGITADSSSYYPAGGGGSQGVNWTGTLALDGKRTDPPWGVGEFDANPWLRLNLGSAKTVGRFRYAPRTGNAVHGYTWNGTITSYKIYVTSNPADWGTPVAQGVWDWPWIETKKVTFAPVSGQYVILQAIDCLGRWNGYPNGPFLPAAAGEVWVDEPTSTAAVATPVLQPPTGSFVSPAGVRITCATSGADIRYTVDGNVPTLMNGTHCADGETIWVSGTGIKTLMARAFASGLNPSQTAMGSYSLTAPPPPGCVNPPSGLVAWWRAEDGANDSVGNNHGTLDNGATTGTFGKAGKGFYFDGGGAKVTIADAPALNFTGSMTVEAWVFRTSGNSIMHVVGKREMWCGGMNYQLAFDPSSGVQFSTWYGGAYSGPGYEIPLNTWTHLAGTHDGTYYRLYVNGVQIGNTGYGSLGQVNSAPLVIGATDNCGYPWQGYIDEVSLYNRALSQGELQAIWAAGVYGKCVGTPIPTVATPVITPGSGSYTAPVTVSVSCNTESPIFIYYSLDGSYPSVLYTGPLTLTSSKTVKARAVKQGWVDSAVATASITALAPSGCVNTPPGLISWWRGEQNANDQTGSSPGTLSVGVTYASGRVGSAFSFTSDGQYVEIPNSVPLSFNDQAMSLEMWVYRTGSAGVMHMAGKRNYCGAYTINYQLAFDTSAGLQFGTDAYMAQSGQDLPMNEWVHLVGTWEGTTYRLFKNGTQIAIRNNAPMYQPTSFPLRIGASGNCGMTFIGKIDEVGVYNRALSEAEAYALYVAGSNGKCVPAVSAPTISPAAGTYPTPPMITLGCSDSGASIYYSLNQNNPTTLYTGSFALTHTGMIYAKATKAGSPDSPTVSASYTVLDGDGDGLNDSWEEQYFTNTNSQNGSGDPDDDGYTNLEEFQQGLSPIVPQAPLYWALNKGEGTVAEETSEFHRNGTITGNPTWEGIGGAITFQGSGRIEAGNAFPLGHDLRKLSLSLWMRPRANADGAILAGKGTSVYGLTQTGDGRVRFYAGAGGVSIVSGSPLSLNDWHYVAATFEQGVMKLYIDNQTAVTGNSGTATTGTGGTFTMGGPTSGTGGYFTGDLQAVKFSPKVLAPGDIPGAVANQPPVVYLDRAVYYATEGVTYQLLMQLPPGGGSSFSQPEVFGGGAWFGRRLVVGFKSGDAMATDRWLPNGLGVNEADMLAGNQIAWRGTVFGTLSGGNGGSALDIAFTASADTIQISETGVTGAALAAVCLRKMTYLPDTDDASPLNRTVEVRVMSGTETLAVARRSVTIIPVNDPPEIRFSSPPVVYTSGAQAIDSQLILKDPDWSNLANAGFGGGILTVEIVQGVEIGDHLGISGGTALGTVSGSGSTFLMVGLNAGVNGAQVQDLLRAITFTQDGTMSMPKAVEFRVSDDGGARSAPALRRIAVAPGALPPLVYAGPDQSIVKPAGTPAEPAGTPAVTLMEGFVSDDGVPGVTSLTVDWAVLESPAGSSVTWGDIHGPTTSAAFSTVGRYKLQLTASDGTRSANDTVVIAVCEQAEAPADIALVTDTSGSTSGAALDSALAAARRFVESIKPGVDQVSVISFTTEANLHSLLTRNQGDMARGIEHVALTEDGGGTDIRSGLAMARAELQSTRHNPAAQPVIILLSDGLQTDETTKDSLQQEATQTKKDGIRIIVVGLPGNQGSEQLALKQLASSNGDFHFVSSVSELLDLYGSIAQSFCIGYRRPLVDAGLDRTIRPNASATLSATLDSGSLGTATYSWDQLSAPASSVVVFDSSTSQSTGIHFSNQSVEGSYVVRVTATFGSSEATVSDVVVITASQQAVVGLPPTALDNYLIVRENSINNLADVLSNDRDLESPNGLVIQSIAPVWASHGQLSIVNEKSLAYTPDKNWSGWDDYTYTVRDSNNNPAQAVVHIFVYHENTPPLARDQVVYVAKDSTIPKVITVLTGGEDPDSGDSVQLAGETPPGHGTLALAVNDPNSFTYLPAAGFAGTDHFSYRVTDKHGASATAEVTVKVVPAGNVAPVAVDDLAQLTSNAGQNWVATDVRLLDSDLNGDTLTVISVGTANHGTVALQPDQTVKYTHTDSYWGADSYTYTISDGHGGTATGTVRVNLVDVSHQNQLPVGDIANLEGTPTVRDGFLDVRGHADDPDATDWVFYSLKVVRLNESMSGAVSGVLEHSDYVRRVPLAVSPAAPGVLGTVDLSGLDNGNYQVQLSVSDLRDTVVEARNFILQSQLKRGLLSFSEQDLAVPVEGLPVTVTRRYNSFEPNIGGTFDPNTLDFGRGWELEINTVRLQKNMPMGQNWGGQFQVPTYCVSDSGPHVITITFPDGRAYRFQAQPILTGSSSGNPGCASTSGNVATLAISFIPIAPTRGSLVMANASDLHIVPGTIGEYNGNIQLSRGGTEVFDGNEFEFTHPDGTKYHFVNGKLVWMQDRQNHQLTIDLDHTGTDGVQHSSGRSATMTRNSHGQIEALYSPKYPYPAGPPAVKYEYDLRDNLAFVHRLTDASTPGNPIYATTQYLYDNGSQFQDILVEIKDAQGHSVLRSEYDAQRRLISVRDALGNRTRFDHNDGLSQFFSPDAKCRETITDAKDQVTIHEFDNHGNLVFSRDPLSKETQMAYDAFDHKLRERDPLGNQTDFTYVTNSAQVEIQTVKLPGATLPTITEFNPFGQVANVTDPLNHITHYEYASNPNQPWAVGKVTLVRDALQHETTYSYPSATSMTVTDSLHGVAEYQYDAHGNVISTRNTTSGGVELAKVSFTYDANGNKETDTSLRKIDPNGSNWEKRVTTWIYDAGDRLLRTEVKRQSVDSSGNPVGGSQLATIPSPNPVVVYNELGQRKSEARTRTRPDQSVENQVTLFDYDLRGNLIQTTYPDGKTVEMKYDELGRVTERKDRAGRWTANIYDAVSRLKEVHYPDRTVDLRQYDGAGRLAVVTDRRGKTTQYGYDAAGRRTSITNALLEVTRQTYDDAGNLKTVTDNLGRTVSYDYDSLNRRTLTTFPNDGVNGVTYARTIYHATENKRYEVDQDNVATEYASDALDRLSSVRLGLAYNPATPSVLPVATADTTETSYLWDEAGNLLQQTDARLKVTRFEYDSFGRRLKRFLPGVGSASQPLTENYSYDEVGNLASKTDFNQIHPNTTLYQYDVLNRLLKKTPDASFGSAPVQFTYTANGQRASVSYPLDNQGAFETVAYEYLDDDRLWKKITPHGTITYDHDDAGNLERMAVSHGTVVGMVVSYTRDDLGRLGQVIDRTDTTSRTTIYHYDSVGNMDTITYPNGVVTSFGHDPLNRLTSVTAGSLASFTYGLGKAGQRKTLAESIPSVFSRSITYGYDPLYRLNSEAITGSAPTGTITYDTPLSGYAGSDGFDAVGNRRTRTVVPSTGIGPVNSTTSTFNDLDQIGGDTYDDNGNTTASGSNSYVFDFENRLVSMNNGAIKMAYDADGIRIRKIVGSTTTHYLMDDRNPTGYAQVLEELNDSGAVTRSYIWGAQLISQRDSAGTMHYYGFDGHGSTRFLTASNGTISDTYSFDAFGNLIGQTGALTPNPYLHSSEQFDLDIGLYYQRARWRIPATGCWLTRDTYEGATENPLSLHQYSYCAADPANRIDPSGNESLVSVSFTSAIMGQLNAHYLHSSAKALGAAQRISGSNEYADLIWGLEAASIVQDKVSLVLAGVGLTAATVKVAEFLSKHAYKFLGNSSVRTLEELRRVASSPESYYVYKELRDLIRQSGLSGTTRGLEAHHLLGKRFASRLGVAEDDIIAVALTPSQHRNVGGMGINIDALLTERFRQIGTTAESASIAQIWQAHRSVYDQIGHPEWAEAVYKAYFQSKGVSFY